VVAKRYRRRYQFGAHLGGAVGITSPSAAWVEWAVKFVASGPNAEETRAIAMLAALRGLSGRRSDYPHHLIRAVLQGRLRRVDVPVA
jgi:hypothetical protein